MLNDTNSQLYVAGYLYGYLTKMFELHNLHHSENVPDLDNPARFDQAGRNPMMGLTLAIKYMHELHVKADEKQIASLFSEIDLGGLPEATSLEQRGNWIAGFMAGKMKNLSKLAMRRKQKNMSQQKLAELSGIPVRNIKAYEIGERKIGSAQADTVVALAKALECTVEDII